jgi:hypothetical protein
VDEQLDWPVCEVDDCTGVSLYPTSRCLAHTDLENRSAILKRLGKDGLLDARGVPIHSGLLADILEALPRSEGQPVFAAARFTRATFLDPVRLDGITFAGVADFSEASFMRPALFSSATFRGEANFSAAAFRSFAAFDRTSFADRAFFNASLFNDGARFQEVAFGSRVSFDRAAFRGPAVFHGAAFDSMASFDAVKFAADAQFTSARFNGELQFGNVRSAGSILFNSSEFSGITELSPDLSADSLMLSNVLFRRPVAIEIAANQISSPRCRFSAGGFLSTNSSAIILEDAEFPRRFIVQGYRGQDLQSLETADSAKVPGSSRPSLLSVRRANVAKLELVGLDLKSCHFAGADNLEGLRIENCEFARAPTRLLRSSGRRVLAEELEWRRSDPRKGPRGSTTGQDSEDWLGDQVILEPGAIASLYRALRTGREDSVDFADFYYGEFEMRRKASRELSSNRIILSLYWLLSGYAQRITRAVLALFLVVALFALLFHYSGFEDPRRPFDKNTDGTTAVALQGTGQANEQPEKSRNGGGLPSLDAWTYSAANATPLSGGVDARLTPAGRLFQLILRIVGILLLALILLSFRVRFKRERPPEFLGP